MKKLISIGVALALLTMAVVPGAVAAEDGITPDTYAKIPFAIIGSGIQLVGEVMGLAQGIVDAMGVDLPFDLTDIGPITDVIGTWTAGPLSWTVDMLAWGMNLAGSLYGTLDTMFEIGYPGIGELLVDASCGLRTCFDDTCAGNFTCPD